MAHRTRPMITPYPTLGSDGALTNTPGVRGASTRHIGKRRVVRGHSLAMAPAGYASYVPGYVIISPAETKEPALAVPADTWMGTLPVAAHPYPKDLDLLNRATPAALRRGMSQVFMDTRAMLQEASDGAEFLVDPAAKACGCGVGAGPVGTAMEMGHGICWLAAAVKALAKSDRLLAKMI